MSLSLFDFYFFRLSLMFFDKYIKLDYYDFVAANISGRMPEYNNLAFILRVYKSCKTKAKV